jgi:hypothetical protein
MFAELVLATKIEPALPVRPIEIAIVSAGGTTPPRMMYVAVGAVALNSEGAINAKLYDAFVAAWLQIVIVDTTAEVAAGTTYTFVCVFADGLIAPNRLYVFGIDYIPDNMKICGVTSIVVFEAATITPAPSN